MLDLKSKWLGELDALKGIHDIREVDASLKSPQFTLGKWRIAIEHQRKFRSVVLKWLGATETKPSRHERWSVCSPSDQQKGWDYREYMKAGDLASLLDVIDRSSQSTLMEDLNSILEKKIDPTTKDALVSARMGQGRFRRQVLGLWGNCCAVTCSMTLKAIRASHIKPWRESSDEERLDPSNGLPLVASLDALFDAGLISFDSSRKLIVSSMLNARERQIYGIGGQSLAKNPTAKTSEYLACHREHVLRR